MLKILKRTLKIIGVVAVITLAFLWYIGVIGHNFHVVTEGKVYRSKQLDCDNLSSHIREKAIKTVLRLNAGTMNDEDYRGEIKASADNHVKHIEVFMSATHLPKPEELVRVLRVFDSAEYPILLHCYGGADRSGLISTIYQVIYEGKPLDDAESDQLTWRFGHFSFGQAHFMDDFFDLYKKHPNGKSLRRWIEEDYARVYAAETK